MGRRYVNAPSMKKLISSRRGSAWKSAAGGQSARTRVYGNSPVKNDRATTSAGAASWSRKKVQNIGCRKTRGDLRGESVNNRYRTMVTSSLLSLPPLFRLMDITLTWARLLNGKAKADPQLGLLRAAFSEQFNSLKEVRGRCAIGSLPVFLREWL